MISEELTFNPIGLEISSVKGRLNLYYFLLLIEIFCPILYAVFASGYHDGGFLLLGLGAELAGVGATLMWFYLMSKISESVDNSTLSQYVKVTFGVLLLGNVFSLFNFFMPEEEWLENVSLIISLVSLIPYILICVHLISNGDSDVRKFGNLLLYVGIIATGVLTFGLVMVANSDLPERSVWRLMLWVCLLICYLQVLPFRCVFNVIDKKDTIEATSVEPTSQVAEAEPIESPSKPEPQSAPQPVLEPAAAPLPQSASPISPMKAVLIGVGAGLMVCGLVFGGIYIFANRSQKVEVDDDEDYSDRYYSYSDNDRGDSESVYPVAVASTSESDERIIPSWLPQEVLDAFGKPNLTEKGYEYYKDNLLRALPTAMEKPVK